MNKIKKDDICLEVKNLRTYFHLGSGGVVKAVDDVSFSLFRGETLGLVGESGCGKSVLMKTIQGIVPSPGVIEGGSVILNGQELISLRKKEMRKLRGNSMAMIFQEPMTSLNPSFRIGWQIEEVYRLHGKYTAKERHERAVELLKKVHIPDPEIRIKGYPHQFSGGMRQRALIAIALACNPTVLFADEPTTALDVTVQADIMDLLENIKKEFDVSIILISHNLNLVSERSDRIIVMYAGKIFEIASAIDITNHPLHPYTIGLLNSLPDIQNENQKLTAIPGELPDLTRDVKGCSFRTRCNRATDVCRNVLPELREISKGHFCRCHNIIEN